jgi:hypothetical protein
MIYSTTPPPPPSKDKTDQFSRNMAKIHNKELPNTVTNPIIGVVTLKKIDLCCCITFLDYHELMVRIRTRATNIHCHLKKRRRHHTYVFMYD